MSEVQTKFSWGVPITCMSCKSTNVKDVRINGQHVGRYECLACGKKMRTAR